MLRWLVDSQALPALMWLMVAQSFVLVAIALYLALQRILLRRPIGELCCRRALELATELSPATGLLGTAVGFSYGLQHLDAADPRGFIVAGLKTAMHTTAYGLVLLIAALLLLALYPWRQR